MEDKQSVLIDILKILVVIGIFAISIWSTILEFSYMMEHYGPLKIFLGFVSISIIFWAMLGFCGLEKLLKIKTRF